MKLKCTIGSAKLKDGTRVKMGDVFELNGNGEESKTLLSHGYAVKVVKAPTPPPSGQDNSDAETAYAADAPGVEENTD